MKITVELKIEGVNRSAHVGRKGEQGFFYTSKFRKFYVDLENDVSESDSVMLGHFEPKNPKILVVRVTPYGGEF